MPQLASDSFIRANENPLNATNWTPVTGSQNLQVSSDACAASNSGNARELYTNATWTADQYSMVKLLAVVSGGVGFRIFARSSVGTPANNYFVNLQNSGSGFGTSWGWQISTGATTLASGSVTVNLNDVFALTCVGTTISLYHNGVLVHAVTDSTVASGTPGLGFNASASFPADQFGPWSGGSIVTTAAPTFSPNGGAVSSTQKVTITSSTVNSTIYYTTDGSTPTTASASIASGATISISSSCTLKAIALSNGAFDSVSTVTSAAFVTRVPLPALRQSCFMANITSSAASYTVAFGNACLPGSILLCTVRCDAQATTTVSDSANGSWARLGNFLSNGSNSGGMWWVLNTARATPTVTIGNSAAVNYNVEAYIGEYTSCTGVRGFGQIARAGVTLTTGTTANAASTVNLGDLIVVGVFNENNNTPAYVAGALSGATGTLVFGTMATSQNANQEWAVATSAGTNVTATATFASGITWDMGIAVLIPATNPAMAFSQAVYNRVASATQVLTFPVACTAGSVLLALVVGESQSGTASCSDPTNGNWIQYGPTVTAGGSTWCALFWVRNTANTALAVTSGFSGNSVACGLICEYVNPSASFNPIDGVSVIQNVLSQASLGTFNYPTIATGAANEQIVLLSADLTFNGGQNIVASGYTTEYNVSPNATGTVLDMFVASSSTSSGSNNQHGTSGSGVKGVVAAIALKTLSTPGGFLEMMGCGIN